MDITNYFIQILKGLSVTMSIFGITLIVSLPLGAVVSLLRLSRFRVIQKLTGIYIWVFRGSPLMLQLMLFGFGLPAALHLQVSNRMLPIYIAFILNYAAYFGEIFRAGAQSIERGQKEAAVILGFNSRQIQTKIVLPQVIKRTLPAVGNEVISLVKDTSLAYVLGVNEILKLAKGIANRDASLIPYLAAGVIFLAMTFIITKILDVLERRISYEE